jgi:hypothetical protein
MIASMWEAHAVVLGGKAGIVGFRFGFRASRLRRKRPWYLLGIYYAFTEVSAALSVRYMVSWLGNLSLPLMCYM